MTSPTPSGEPQPVDVIVFGLDDAGKAHASRFDAVDAELATRAAGKMGMRVLRLVTPEQHAAAAGVPQGRIFASGKGFVPFVKMSVHERLAALAGPVDDAAPKNADAGQTEDGKPATTDASAEAADEPDGTGGEPPIPADRAAIRPGVTVLAPERDRASWWPAIVLRRKDETRWVLKWRDFDDPPSIVRKRDEIALMPPAFGA